MDGMAISEEFVPPDRTAQVREYAERRARGGVENPLTQLAPHERRRQVRHTLLEDHRSGIENRPYGAQCKIDTLAADPFVIFRGTALLYYRDHAGTDAHLPIVFTIGDVHPKSIGAMPNSDGTPIFGVATLGLDEQIAYARVCARALAQAHARSDDETDQAMVSAYHSTGALRYRDTS